MTSFEEQHYFVIEKEELGIILAKCIRHQILEFGVGIRRNEYVEMIYIGADKKHAEKLYLKLVSEKKKSS